VVLLPSTSVEDARLVLARVVATLPIGCSVGVTDWPAGSTFDEAVRGADREMYTHKRRHDS
jgi:GGDEF domain-containing protein